jgi:hypothetical protein
MIKNKNFTPSKSYVPKKDNVTRSQCMKKKSQAVLSLKLGIGSCESGSVSIFWVNKGRDDGGDFQREFLFKLKFFFKVKKVYEFEK